MELDTLFNLLVTLVAFAAVGFIGFIRTKLKARNKMFESSQDFKGTVLSVTKKQSLSLPIIQYKKGNKTFQFTSAVSANSVKEGQLVDVQVAPNGIARLKGSSSNLTLHILSASMALFFVLACLFVYNKFF